MTNGVHHISMVKDPIYRYDSFCDGKVLHGKKKNHLPAMGWNSWNAFGSGNTEKLTKEMADAVVSLGLKELGYQYIVLDDGCYKPERINGKLANEEKKFPSGFKALSDYVHDKGLKFGMYNDIGTNLCAGAAVGTCGYEEEDAKTYVDWGVDFLKVDNCYYLWDNATFSDPTNAKYVYAPNIKAIRIEGQGTLCEYDAVERGVTVGNGIEKSNDYVTNIGTYDGTGPQQTPVGMQSGELLFNVTVPQTGEYNLSVCYATGEEEGVGCLLQVALQGEDAFAFDDCLKPTDGKEEFEWSDDICVQLCKGENTLRLMNHRRQENTLGSYGTLLKALNDYAPENDIIFSACEWGKTQPQNWAYKVADSWRILNDITFQVGADGDPGAGQWCSDYTTSVLSQYNKAVIMDEFSGLSKGWNDPDMLMIGMNGLDTVMCKTHMTMWCMMNAPLMLGLDLRRVSVGDDIYNIIANKKVIGLNQDSLGVQAKRIYCSAIQDLQEQADATYVTEPDRMDILAKPLADGSIALSFINLSTEKMTGNFEVSTDQILKCIGSKMTQANLFKEAASYEVEDLWTGMKKVINGDSFCVTELDACDNITIKVTPV